MSNSIKIIEILELVKNKKPLVHHLTNYVTVNDCANITLSIGCSPIMADDIEEMEDITKISSSIVLNIGTLNERTIKSMVAAGIYGNNLNIPVVFDPVGAGASNLRNMATKKILNEVKVSVIKGNISEISYISGISSNTRGVDASVIDQDIDPIQLASNLAIKMRCVVVITGATDIISDGKNSIHIENGHKMMSDITGTGCMCSSLIGSFIGAAPESSLYSTAAAILCMGIAGEIAFEESGKLGLGSYHISLLNAISKLNVNILKERAKIIERKN